jgi:signal transduction histidine kinase
VQPAINSLEDATKKEMLIYGLMLGITIIMMTLGALLIARDIKRESDSMSLKTEFVHNVSHELKTPLSLIRLYGETLLFKKNLNNTDKTDALQVITKESERLSHMINNILDFSKIEMGRKEFKIQRGNFANIIRDTLDSYRYHLEKKGFEIIEELAQDIPLIEFDKEAIEGLLINLLSNAIKYSPERKILTVKLYTQNENVLLQVSDKGVGIPSDEIPHIFNRFYRSKQKLGFESRGSGLGLTLIKHVVESHGGKIKVESKPGEGSTFSIEFPILKSFLGNKV